MTHTTRSSDSKEHTSSVTIGDVGGGVHDSTVAGRDVSITQVHGEGATASVSTTIHEAPTKRGCHMWYKEFGLSIIVVLACSAVGVGGYFLGWWESLFSPGTAGPPQPTYPAPEDGYTCLPTCDETDGKFLSMPGEQMASFGGESIVVWVSVPADAASFELGFFDGDSGKDNSGNVNPRAGNWDNTTTESTYTLYVDPLKDGSGTTVVGSWRGNSDPMPNNDWYDVTLNNVPEAQGPSGHYFYRLECTRPVEGYGINALKLRSTGYLSTGQADLVDASFAIVGMIATINDVPILYPEFQGDYNSLGPSNYTGNWHFYLYIPEDTATLEFWDGDFDRGSSSGTAADLDDPNAEGTPPWAGLYVVPERAGGRGAPADDHFHPLLRREPPVWYELIAPEGLPIHTNMNPSGTGEWENFIISTDPNVQADLHTVRIVPGFYTWYIEGLDLNNIAWIHTSYEIVDEPPPPVWLEGSCPRTIGYWKNNVRKVLIQGRTRGVQESRESLEWALRNVALASPLFRSGIGVNNPVPIASPTRLTDQEANAILQRENGNSLLDRALQQNLAAWLNLGSGKIGPNTVVTLDVHGGTFHGTVWEALQEAQDIILNGGDLERAKDIADQINNGLLGEEAETSTCEDYTAVIPPDEQPPDYEDLPEAPTPVPPPNPTPAPEVTCDAPRVNTYNIENPTNYPFHGIKFEYHSGTEVRDGDFEVFTIVLTAEQAAALTSVPMEAKAGTNVGQVTLENCVFDEPLPCAGEPVQDENGFFAFAFLGTKDNNDGTLTVSFLVQNFTPHSLRSVVIGLPNDVSPLLPENSYESTICP